MSFPDSLEKLPPDWRAAVSMRRLLWEGGYDPALVSVRDRDKAKVPIDARYMTFMWLFYSRDPQQWSETYDAFEMPPDWLNVVVEPGTAGTLPTLRAALAFRFARFFGVAFNDPVVVASVEHAFSDIHRAGPFGYLAAVSNMLWMQASRWRRCQRLADRFPLLRLRADDHLATKTGTAFLDGVVLPVQHEFWSACFPPNNVSNVGLVEQMAPSVMKRRGYTVSTNLPDDWRSLLPAGFDRNFAARWPDVVEPDLLTPEQMLSRKQQADGQ